MPKGKLFALRNRNLIFEKIELIAPHLSELCLLTYFYTNGIEHIWIVLGGGDVANGV